MSLDKKVTEKLEKILAKENQALTEADIEFLRARKSYIDEENLERLASVLPTKEEKVVTTADRLKDMTRPQLDQIADDLGLNPSDYQNKDEIKVAILAFDGKSDEEVETE